MTAAHRTEGGPFNNCDFDDVSNKRGASCRAALSDSVFLLDASAVDVACICFLL